MSLQTEGGRDRCNALPSKRCWSRLELIRSSRTTPLYKDLVKQCQWSQHSNQFQQCISVYLYVFLEATEVQKA